MDQGGEPTKGRERANRLSRFYHRRLYRLRRAEKPLLRSEARRPMAGLAFALAGAVVADLVCAGLSGEEAGDVLDGRARDVVQRLFGQERLMRRDQHVRHRDQPRERVVVDDVAGEILEEDVGLLLVCLLYTSRCV